MIDLESLSYQQKLEEIKNEVDKSVLDPYFHSSLIENANNIKFRIKERAFKAQIRLRSQANLLGSLTQQNFVEKNKKRLNSCYFN